MTWFLVGCKWFGSLVVGEWLGLGPAYRTLGVMMFFDVLTGFLAAISNRSLCEWRMVKGLIRKAMVVCFVAAIHYFSDNLSNHIQLPIDAAPMFAIAFCVSELLSITRNCKNAGIVFPKIIEDKLCAVSSFTNSQPDPQVTPAAPFPNPEIK